MNVAVEYTNAFVGSQLLAVDHDGDTLYLTVTDIPDLFLKFGQFRTDLALHVRRYHLERMRTWHGCQRFMTKLLAMGVKELVLTDPEFAEQIRDMARKANAKSESGHDAVNAATQPNLEPATTVSTGEAQDV